MAEDLDSSLSAVGGIKEATPSMTEDLQQTKLGTASPLLFIAGIGVYNFIKFDPTVVKALNPLYIIHYFKRNKKDAWISLGGIVLCITGTEAMFADVGHFSVGSIQISMCAVTYPALILAYTGQASFLRKHNQYEYISDAFFKSIPGPMYWPMFVVAVLEQSLSLGCFPRNYCQDRKCIRDCCGVSDGAYIGILVLIMILIWKTHILLVMLYVVVVGTVELLYLSSVLYKFDQGGYLPLAFAFFIMVITYIWNDVYRRKYYYELDHKICPEKLKGDCWF
ncbi:hypothetical protein TEA_001517 [Camellia sinensis var. sinensis]|uniref:K+ potassium transporter integral membrane domain-containing protein n=1 Tax=Camellia sinensis var. sinensis TaxID=542762 RepID=A0A4S4E8B7_CAMSN|nr:hypothetical protein TEA_001517 [Camellia sinensis var. sinensis]